MTTFNQIATSGGRKLLIWAGAAVTAVLGLVLLLSFTGTASAQEGSADALRVSPVRTDISVKPGESKTVKLQVTNLTDQDIRLTPEQNDFIAGDEKGTPALILDADQSAPTHSLKQFMKPLEVVSLKSNETKTVPVKISVPKGAQAGGYFGAVRFTPTVPGSGGQVNLNTHVAPLILLTVPGNLVEKLDLTDFKVEKAGKSAAFFTDAADMMVKTRFENKGNIQLGPFGEIAVRKSGRVVASSSFNGEEPVDMTLPDSARRWDVPLDGIGGFGKYEVLGTFSYGQNNQTIEASTSFWIIPLWMQIAALAVLVIIAVVVVLVPILIKRKRRRTRR